jgi:hypothetical protein
MPDKDVSVLYDSQPIRAGMAAAVLLGIGGLVCVPIGLINRAWWLLLLAVPLLLAGLVLLQVRLRIVVEHGTGAVYVTNFLLGLKLREQRYPPGQVRGFDLRRVAGDERERASDTWYLTLGLRTRIYTVGKYDSRVHALEARRKLSGLLQAALQARPAVEAKAAAAGK